MVLVDLLAALFILLLLALALTQIVLPIQRGTPIFPMLLHDNRKLDKDLAQVNHDIEVDKISETIEQKRKRIKKATATTPQG